MQYLLDVELARDSAAIYIDPHSARRPIRTPDNSLRQHHGLAIRR